jgi:DNA polymerase III subunit delta
MAAKQRPSEMARAFFASLKNAELKPIYYLFGEESYLLDQAVRALIKVAAPEGLNAFNSDQFSGKETSGAAVRSACETLPFMVKRRVVIVRDMQELDLRQLADLEDYFTDPSPSTCLILHAMTAQKAPDGRSGAMRKLKKAAESWEFKPFYAEDVEQFILKQAHLRKIRLTNAAAAYMMEAVGHDLASQDQALDKLDLYLGAAPEMRDADVDEVQQIVAITRVQSIFELTDSIGDRKIGPALTALDAMMVAGEPAIKINQMIARHFRILAKLHDPSVQRADRSHQASAVGVSPFFLKDYTRHSQKFSGPEIERILARVIDLDIQLKSSKLDDRLLLESMMLDLIRPGHAASAPRGHG